MKRKYADVAVMRLVVNERVVTACCTSPSDAARFSRPFFKDLPAEQMAALYLDAGNHVKTFCVLTVGILNSSLIHPREVFQRAVLANAAGVILVHNHPSGNPEPSSEDIRVTRQLVDAGKLMGIPIHDHIILAGDKHTSLAERGLI